jgi:hypothetical protein
MIHAKRTSFNIRLLFHKTAAVHYWGCEIRRWYAGLSCGILNGFRFIVFHEEGETFISGDVRWTDVAISDNVPIVRDISHRRCAQHFTIGCANCDNLSSFQMYGDCEPIVTLCLNRSV